MQSKPYPRGWVTGRYIPVSRRVKSSRSADKRQRWASGMPHGYETVFFCRLRFNASVTLSYLRLHCTVDAS